MNTRYFIRLSFKGSRYHGWQIQSGSPTVQETLQNDLGAILGENTPVTGAGRTDAGVHARIFYAHFDSIHSDLHCRDKLIYNLNGKLPSDISIQEILHVDREAHARFSALSRTYEYQISRIKDPFLQDFAMEYFGKLDTEAMTEATGLLQHYTDFTSFSRTGGNTKTNECRIMEAGWTISEEMMVFRVKADRFLRNMVRAIVGTLLDVGTGRTAAGDVAGIIDRKDRSGAGASVPAHGLALTGIEYPEDVFLD